MSIKKNEQGLLVEAARLYYQHDFNQQQIARRLGISRPGVSRLLQRAREQGIVRIEIRDPQEKGTQIESMLREKFSLKKAIVVPAEERSALIKKHLGEATISYLNDLITNDMTIGVSWGTTMQEVANALQPKKTKNLTVVQLNGGVSKAAYDTHASEIAQTIGMKYQAVPYLLPLPAIVDSADLKRSIISDKNIARTLKLAAECEIAVYTIGLFNRESVLVKADYFEEKEIVDLMTKGAVADICSRIIDVNGQICSRSLNARTIGIELDNLAAKKHAIAVAGGREKLPSIRAALKGKWMNSLITDEWTAEELIQD
jgi:deoxyribonucleoside regulator